MPSNVLASDQIVGITDVPNVSSWRVLERLGMREFRPPNRPAAFALCKADAVASRALTAIAIRATSLKRDPLQPNVS